MILIGMAFTPYNHLDFLKYFTWKFNIYYLYLAGVSFLAFLFIIVPYSFTSYDIFVNKSNFFKFLISFKRFLLGG